MTSSSGRVRLLQRAAWGQGVCRGREAFPPEACRGTVWRACLRPRSGPPQTRPCPSSVRTHPGHQGSKALSPLPPAGRPGRAPHHVPAPLDRSSCFGLTPQPCGAKETCNPPVPASTRGTVHTLSRPPDGARRSQAWGTLGCRGSRSRGAATRLLKAVSCTSGLSAESGQSSGQFQGRPSEVWSQWQSQHHGQQSGDQHPHQQPGQTEVFQVNPASTAFS